MLVRLKKELDDQIQPEESKERVHLLYERVYLLYERHMYCTVAGKSRKKYEDKEPRQRPSKLQKTSQKD